MARMTDDDVAQLPPGLALAWGRLPVSRRGPKPGHSVEEIVRTALELADEEGLAAVSMPKLGTRLGVTANALYRYVSSKEELLVLLTDVGWGPPPASLPDAEHWRESARTWALGMVSRFETHPWLLDMPVRSAPMTPYLVRWMEVLLQSMAGSGLGIQDSLGCALLLDGYARSTAQIYRDLSRSDTPPLRSATVTEFLLPLLRERDYPMTVAMMTGGMPEDDGGDREFGLTRILDGIETLIASKLP
jgi:AcrR family transcriptional regulator